MLLPVTADCLAPFDWVLAISAASALSAVGVSLITYSVALRKTAAKRRLELRVAPSFSARGAGLSLTGRFG